MASSSSGKNSSSMSTRLFLQSSGSEEDLRLLMDQRKRKRKQSNRESARRSRMKKQSHLDDLVAQSERLKKENSEILARLNITTQHHLNIDAQNCILRAQMVELGQRLQSLNGILYFINTSTNYDYGTNYGGFCEGDSCLYPTSGADHSFMNHMNIMCLNQPIMASADHMFQW